MSEPQSYEPPDLMIGRRIGSYVIDRKLAEGGMGAVYTASHEKLGVTKVVKTLLPHYARHAMLRDRFEREALAVSRLRHRNIVTIDDYGQLADGQLYLMMPFLRGRPLDTYLRECGKFTPHRTLHIIVQVCSALQYMHDAGFVHRDIKPSNIFICEEEDNPYHVVLIDLGIAKSIREEDGAVTNTGAAMGTPHYMAVEQYEDASTVTALADVCAVCIVAWELITGQLPWGRHPSHVLYSLQKQQIPMRPLEMSAEWYAILCSGISPVARERPASVRALAVALASSVEAIPPHVPSGAEILIKLAKSFVRNTPPSAETVRNSGSNQERVAPILWPPRETHPTPPSRGASAGQQREPAKVTVTQNTLSSSNGSVTAPTESTWRPLFVATLAMLAMLVGGMVTYSVVRRGDRSERGYSGVPTVQHGATVEARSLPIDASVPNDAPIMQGSLPVDAAGLDAAFVKQEAAKPSEAAPRPAQVRKPGNPSGAAAPNGTGNAGAPRAGVKDKHPSSSGKFDPNAVEGD